MAVRPPKLIITCGVSGAVQFTAGMNHAETIVAINKDPKAPIFKTAHYCLTGDLYEILPRLIEKIEMEDKDSQEGEQDIMGNYKKIDKDDILYIKNTIQDDERVS